MVPHNLKEVLMLVVRKSVLSNGRDRFVSVWLTTPKIEGQSEPDNPWHRQGICIGEKLTQSEAEELIDEYRSQLGLEPDKRHLGEGI